MEKKDYTAICEGIVKVFSGVLEEIFERENKEDGKEGRPNYMPQTILGSRYRAFIAIFVAVKKSFVPMYKILALAISKHRFECHDEKTLKTQEALKRSMTSSEIKVAETRGWSG